METLKLAAVEALLKTRLLGRPLQYFASVTSTQDLVRAAANAGAAEGLAVAAGEQTAGRGRAGRTWWSPPTGGIYLSVLLRPDLPGEQVPWLTMCMTLGAADAVAATCGLRPDIKWPNDLELEGRKLAGILAEGAFSGDRLDYVVVGLGLNANIDFDSQPELRAVATSLQQALGYAVDPNALLAEVLNCVEARYLAMRRGVSPVAAWAARLVTLGRPVVAQASDGRRLAGLASRVLPDGALCIRLDDGTEEIVRAVDVTLRHER